jgi:23S rRNA (adenine2503-C2)-methyltransferase
VRILENIATPTGNILIVQGSRGKLEMLSLGDYGKDVNLKANFMGLDRRPSPVRHTDLLPLEEKWVITISTQYGCSTGCRFCDVPEVGLGVNVSYEDLIGQVVTGIRLHPGVKSTARLNIHFARMGEPSWNPYVTKCARKLMLSFPDYNVHPVVSTMMPRKHGLLGSFIRGWMDVKNQFYEGNAGLQLSINSTDEKERDEMFSGNACTLAEIAGVMAGVYPRGRKITLNFALAGYEIDPAKLLRHFSPDHYLIKLTPMHRTRAAKAAGIKTKGDATTYEPYAVHEQKLTEVGYDVLVFIASKEEDESRITCGNAVLADEEAVT